MDLLDGKLFDWLIERNQLKGKLWVKYFSYCGKMLAIKIKSDFKIARYYGQVEKAVLIQNVPDEKNAIICLAPVILS